MAKVNKKHIISSLALGLCSLGFAQFQDVPSNHWAKTAVETMSKCGLLLGFPDGTFRGSQAITRYQAALIFYRYIQNPDMCKLSDETKTDIGMASEELSAEIAELADSQQALIENQDELEARVAALEAAAEQTPAPQVQQPVNNTASLEARIAKLEEHTHATDYDIKDGLALEARVAALEAKQVADIDATNAKVAKLEAELAMLKQQIANLSTVNTTPINNTTPIGSTPTIPPIGSTPIRPRSTTTNSSTLYFGIGANYIGSMPQSSVSLMQVNGHVGYQMNNVGARVDLDYSPSNGLHDVSGYITLGNLKGLYGGVGARYTLSDQDGVNSSSNPSGYLNNFEGPGMLYGSGIAGFGLPLGPVAAFAEGELTFGNNTQIAFGIKGGLRLHF